MSLDVPSTGAAAILTKPYGEPYTFVQEPVTPPGPNDAIVSIDFSGICHGDVYSRDGGGPAPAVPNRPLIGGHEGVGRIIALGDSQAAGSFKVGDLVGIAWRSSVCGKCEACRYGRENFCEKQVVTGMHRFGTFQRWLPQLLSIKPR